MPLGVSLTSNPLSFSRSRIRSDRFQSRAARASSRCFTNSSTSSLSARRAFGLTVSRRNPNTRSKSSIKRTRSAGEILLIRATSRVMLSAVGKSRSSLMAVWKAPRKRRASSDHVSVSCVPGEAAASSSARSSRRLFRPFCAAVMDSSVKLIFDR